MARPRGRAVLRDLCESGALVDQRTQSLPGGTRSKWQNRSTCGPAHIGRALCGQLVWNPLARISDSIGDRALWQGHRAFYKPARARVQVVGRGDRTPEPPAARWGTADSGRATEARCLTSRRRPPNMGRRPSESRRCRPHWPAAQKTSDILPCEPGELVAAAATAIQQSAQRKSRARCSLTSQRQPGLRPTSGVCGPSYAACCGTDRTERSRGYVHRNQRDEHVLPLVPSVRSQMQSTSVVAQSQSLGPSGRARCVAHSCIRTFYERFQLDCVHEMASW